SASLSSTRRKCWKLTTRINRMVRTIGFGHRAAPITEASRRRSPTMSNTHSSPFGLQIRNRKAWMRLGLARVTKVRVRSHREDFESMTSDEPEFDIVIVGCGPVGAVTACWLGQAGVKTLVVEKSRSIWEIPRAMALDHEILRVFQNIGVIQKVFPYTAPFGISEHYGAAGQLIRTIGVVPPP